MFVLSVVKYTGLGIITLIKHSMFNLLSSKKNIYKYYYNTKLKDLNLLNPINIYLFYNRFIKYSLLKLYKDLNNLLRVKVYNNLNRIYVKSSIVIIRGLISALLYSRRKLYTCVIYLNNIKVQSKVNESDTSNSNDLQLGKY